MVYFRIENYMLENMGRTVNCVQKYLQILLNLIKLLNKRRALIAKFDRAIRKNNNF